MDARLKISFERKHTDVCSLDGMLDFVRKGKLSNHMTWIPAFNKEETRMIIEYIRDRNADENDSYNIYITKKPIFYTIYGYQEDGILYSDNFIKNYQGINDYLYLENKTLANLCVSYANEYIPNYCAISKAKTTEFLNTLIKDYLS